MSITNCLAKNTRKTPTDDLDNKWHINCSCLQCLDGVERASSAHNTSASKTLEVAVNNKMPCYRKDDRAMRPIYGMDALKYFRSPWLRPRLLFPKLLMTAVVIDRMKVHQMAHVGISQSRNLKLRIRPWNYFWRIPTYMINPKRHR